VAGEALRQVFAEFGFKVDDAPLEKMLADTERQIKLEESLSKTEKKVLADVQRSAAEREKAKTAEAAEATKAAEAATKAAEEEKKALLDTIPGLRMLSSLKGSVRARALGLAAGMGAVVAVAHQFAVAFAADVAALREASDAARVTETQFQQLAFAGNAAGVGADVVTGSLNTLAEGLRAIEARTGGPTNALWRLGVRARNTDGTIRDTNDVLLDLADRFERVRSPVHRARLAQELFGASGRRMLQVLAGGSAALRRQREDFAALGGGVLPEAVEQGRRFAVAQGRMQVALDSVRSVIATSLLPVVTYLTDGVANVTGWLSRMTRGSNLVSVALAGVGAAAVTSAGAAIIAWAPVVLPIAAAAAGLALLGLVADDVVTFFRGGNSVIGRFVDHLYGVGAARETIQYLPILWRDVTEWIDAASLSLERFLTKWNVLETLVGSSPRLTSIIQGQRPAAVPIRGRQPTAPLLPGAATVTGRRGVRLTSITPTVDRTPTAPTQPDYLRALSYMPAMTAPVRGGNRTVQMTTQNTFQITGVTDPQEAARRVAAILDERARRQRDEAHPQDAEE
jgi:hypothetical protein